MQRVGMMEQTYHPNLNVKGYAGMCLQYVDDAGNAPMRSGSARAAFDKEYNSGRIRTDTIPENIWLVGWLDFTKGQYVAYGHVFLFRRSGSTYEIHDSEVHRGARKPYTSLDEIIRWFGVYSPKYIGWSTNCDGRQYAKAKEDEMIIEIQPPVFNRWYYLEQNPDLKKNGINAENAEAHWYEYGAHEGRNSAPNFHVKEYIENYADLKKEFSNNYRGAVKHYYTNGINEGRSGIKIKPSNDDYIEVKEKLYRRK